MTEKNYLNDSKRQLLVTAALPYANGKIHIGHLVEHIQTDIWVRFQNLIGNEAYFMCADDAHGTAIMLSAEQQNLNPEDYINIIQKEHMDDLKGFLVKYDHYYTTHSEENKALSEEIYLAAKAAKAITKQDIDQFFCKKSALFLADRYVKERARTATHQTNTVIHAKNVMPHIRHSIIKPHIRLLW